MKLCRGRQWPPMRHSWFDKERAHSNKPIRIMAVFCVDRYNVISSIISDIVVKDSDLELGED
jgi:hypothetical protein